MKRIIILGTAGTLAFLANAQVQDKGSPRQRPLPPILAALDANTDRVISAEELANAPTALRTLDKNGDGKLAEAELMPQRSGSPPGGDNATARKRFSPPFISALDKDSDGSISADEIAAAATSLKTLDKNGDGQLSEMTVTSGAPRNRSSSALSPSSRSGVAVSPRR